MKRRLVPILSVGLLYLATYFICRYTLNNIYTPEWTARHFLLIAAIISLAPAIAGWRIYPYITFSGYIIGIVLGELFGGFQSDIPPQYLHDGWLICIAVYFISVIAASLIEISKKRKSKNKLI